MRWRSVLTVVLGVSVVATVAWTQTFPVRIEESPPEFPEPDSGVLQLPGLVLVDSEDKVVGEVIGTGTTGSTYLHPSFYHVVIRIKGEPFIVEAYPGPLGSGSKLAIKGRWVVFRGGGCTGPAYVANDGPRVDRRYHALEHRYVDGAWRIIAFRSIPGPRLNEPYASRLNPDGVCTDGFDTLESGYQVDAFPLDFTPPYSLR